MDYHWPGNVRELKNVIERAVILNEGNVIDKEDIAFIFSQNPAPPSSGEIPFTLPPEGICLEDLEKSLIIQALQRAQWNKTRAAQLLSISRDTLKYRMKKYGIEIPTHSGGEA